MTRQVVFLSSHVYGSRRRAGFHALARSFAEGGWRVAFVTTGLSALSVLRRDRRIGEIGIADVLGWKLHPDGVESAPHLTLLHPVSVRAPTLGFLETAVAAYYRRTLRGRILDRIAAADIVVFESSSAIFFYDAVRAIAPRARLVYRVSDDVRIVGMGRSIVEKEDEVAKLMDLVSVPSRLLLERRFPLSSARFHPHGVPKELAITAFPDPFPSNGRVRLVCLGSTLFDIDFVALSAQALPTFDFHYVGNVPALNAVSLPNVIAHGELPFERALAFAAHADVGLANYALPPGGEYLAETSNKMAQYAFFGKPIVAPANISQHARYQNVHFYTRGDAASIAGAVESAASAGPVVADASLFPRWDDIRDAILSDLARSSAPAEAPPAEAAE